MKEMKVFFRRRWRFATIVLCLYTLLLSSRFVSPSSCLNFPTQEYNALHDLYTSTNGNHWIWKKNYTMYGIPWNFTTSISSTTGAVVLNNPCNQRWQGITCTSTSSPSSSSSFCSVIILTLSYYNLKGTLPNSISTLSNLTSLSINYNPFLIGTIPTTIGNLSQLTYLDFRKNAHTGVMPSSLSKLSKLQSLYIQQNYLTGSIPEDIGGMSSIITFDIRSNEITGSLPQSILQMTSMQSLLIYINLLTGTIPSDIGQYLTQLVFFDVRGNFFSGSLPNSMCQLTLLTDLFAYNNLFTGTIPSNIQQMSTLELFVLDYNFITGSIPSGLYAMNKLSIFSMYRNFLDSSLPSSLSTLKAIEEFSVNDNFLTGSIPSMSNLYHLSELRLDSNYFYGPIPNFFATSPQLSIFNVSDNYVSSTIPSGFSFAKALQTIDVSHNIMIGEINSTAFSSLPILNQIVLRSNSFHGHIDGLVNATAQPYLTLIDISDNSFSGTIPQEIFRIRNLTSFVAAKNCFTGSLPDNVCLPRHSLVNLILDGLHTAGSCQTPIFSSGIIKTYGLSNPLEGSIPACLFENMKVLNTLHLGGNGILGSIPSIKTISPSLQSLSLAHNRLTGTIPSTMQTYPHWVNLDLSFNRLTGTMASNITGGTIAGLNTSLSLNVNRLSGIIPNQLRSMMNINILEGNMFSCKEFGKTDSHGVSVQLPEHDNYANSYTCGSNNLNGVLYAWLILFFCLLVFIVLISTASRCAHNAVMNAFKTVSYQMQEWYNAAIDIKNTQPSPNPTVGDDEVENVKPERKPLPRRVYEYGLLLREVRRWSFALGVLLFITALPLYSSLSLHYGTFAFQYAYTFSIGFLGGKLPAYVMLVYLSLLVCAVYMDSFSSILPCNLLRIKHAFVKQLTKENALTNRESLLLFEPESAATLSALPMTVEFSGNDGEQSRNHSSNSETSSLTTGSATSSHKSGSQYFNFQAVIDDIRRYYEYYALTAALLLFNVLLVVGINMIYVYAIAQDIPASAKQFITLLLSVYKLVWNNVVVANLRETMHNKLQSYLNKGGEAISHHYYSRREILKKQVWIMPCMLWLSLFNNIIAPFLAVALISVDCFYYAITSAPKETVSISFEECEQQLALTSNNTILSSNVCNSNAYSQYQISYEPPFTYNYQCSSTLLINFADIFVIRFLISGLIIPAVMMFVKYIQELAYSKLGDESLLYQFCTIILPPMIRPVTSLKSGSSQVPMHIHTNVSVDANNTDLQQSPSRPSSLRYSHSTRKSSVAETINNRFSKSLEWMYSGKVKLKIVDSTIVIATDVAVMLTFGTVFPPLAVIGCVTLLIRTYLEQLAIGRLYSLSLVQHQLLNVMKALNDECQGVSQLLITGLSSLAFIVTLFWACFLFDIHGDAVGFKGSIWIFPLLPILALLLPFIDQALGFFVHKMKIGATIDDHHHGEERQTDTSSQLNIEMRMTQQGSILNPLTAAPS